MPDASDLGAPEETTNGEASPLKVTDQELGELTDQRLMSMVRGAGDDDVVASRAFGELYRRRYDEVFRQATFRLRDRHQAEEITSEAMFKTYRALRGGKGPSDSFVGYVMTAVRSETIRSAEESMLTDPMEHEELESVAEVPDESFEDFYSEREQLCNAFRELPAKSRRALWLLEVEGQSVERTAELFHMNEGSVRQLSFRARESFRALYLQQHVDVAPERCQPTASLLGRYVRGTLKGSRFEAVADHVAHCERCTDQVARLKRLNSLLRVSIGPVLIGAAAGTGYGIYGAGTVQAGVAAAITDRTGAARKWWTAGVAAAILLMIGGGSAWCFSTEPILRLRSALTRSAIPTLPGKISASQRTRNLESQRTVAPRSRFPVREPQQPHRRPTARSESSQRRSRGRTTRLHIGLKRIRLGNAMSDLRTMQKFFLGKRNT